VRNLLILLGSLSLFLAGCGHQETDNRRIEHDHAVSIGGYEFGFVDGGYNYENAEPNYRRWTQMHLGPLGTYAVPFSAPVGWVLIGVLIWLAVMLTFYFVVKRDRLRNRGGMGRKPPVPR
jgi:hypothetical protein